MANRFCHLFVILVVLLVAAVGNITAADGCSKALEGCAHSPSSSITRNCIIGRGSCNDKRDSNNSCNARCGQHSHGVGTCVRSPSGFYSCECHHVCSPPSNLVWEESESRKTYISSRKILFLAVMLICCLAL